MDTIHVVYVPDKGITKCIYLGGNYDEAYDLYCLYQRLGLLTYWIMKLDGQSFCIIRSSIGHSCISRNVVNQ